MRPDDLVVGSDENGISVHQADFGVCLEGLHHRGHGFGFIEVVIAEPGQIVSFGLRKARVERAAGPGP